MYIYNKNELFALCLQCVRHCSEVLTCINSFNLTNFLHGSYYYSNLTDEETETPEAGEEICIWLYKVREQQSWDANQVVWL